MKKNQIKRLADVCFKNGELKEENINQVLPYLKRKDMKIFIKELENLDQKNTVIVTCAAPLSEKTVSKITSMYPDKKVRIEIDPQLILGVRIVSNDSVYSANLDDILQKMVSHVSET